MSALAYLVLGLVLVPALIRLAQRNKFRRLESQMRPDDYSRFRRLRVVFRSAYALFLVLLLSLVLFPVAIKGAWFVVSIVLMAFSGLVAVLLGAQMAEVQRANSAMNEEHHG